MAELSTCRTSVALSVRSSLTYGMPLAAILLRTPMPEHFRCRGVCLSYRQTADLPCPRLPAAATWGAIAASQVLTPLCTTPGCDAAGKLTCNDASTLGALGVSMGSRFLLKKVCVCADDHCVA